MISFALSRSMVLVGGAVLAALSPVAPAIADDGSEHLGAGPRVSVQPVRTIASQEVVPGAGTVLVRTREGVFATFHASGLAPGTVATAWFAIFNFPRHCATSPCTSADLVNPEVQASVLGFGGRILGADGTATYGAFRAVGDATAPGGPPGTPNAGLMRPLRAEIHLVTRTHGPALLDDPEVLAQQLGMFNGGCPPNTCANLQASIHQR